MRLTLAGTASLWIAVLADMGASLVVIANGLRLLRRPAHGTRANAEHNDTARRPAAEAGADTSATIHPR